MNEKQQPLVSCIMPTYNRRAFVPHAIRYFLRQDYENKELIIIDDGTDCIKDLIPVIETIRYFRLDQKISLGAKLNLACKYAIGKIIANWDDDDWYATRRLTYQVNALQNEGTYVCGINKLLYYDLRNDHAYQYIYPPDQRTWLLGSSLCYTKELWNRIQFADINIGMDALFVWATSKDRITVLPDSTIAVHMIHDKNVSPKKTEGGWWHAYPLEEIKNILRQDWNCYHTDGLISAKPTVHERVNISAEISAQQVQLQNVYACLVHENEDCITDLVHNLNYHDPDSIILLYNGGQNPNLLKDYASFSNPRVVIHPDPKPMKHGYLHSFALDCMQFTVDHLPFDIFTIVDSDQLCIRSGYTQYLTKLLYPLDGIGMLSSMPERITSDDKLNNIAIQAFKEYDLWKTFLINFSDGESKFVHWSFWPSTVFSSAAVRDLVKIFKENKQLQDIMKRTKIWASEEVILPTLVRLLGYQIVANPCGYDFVKYRKTYTYEELNNAFNKTDVYWIHPVERRYDNSTRKYIRERFNQYSKEIKAKPVEVNTTANLSFKLSLINQVKIIEGWLSDLEADLLIEITLNTGKKLPLPFNVVEIGSYHGKSTVLFGSVIQKNFPGAKVYAIDPHDGKLGAEDQGLQSFPPSFEMFKNNIDTAGLSQIIEIFKGHCYGVIWTKPVSLLFIDGLHDYANVSRDFSHFANWLIPGGYIAFHDYAAYFPGVKRFVDELLETRLYKKVHKVDTLIVLQKL